MRLRATAPKLLVSFIAPLVFACGGDVIDGSTAGSGGASASTSLAAGGATGAVSGQTGVANSTAAPSSVTSTAAPSSASSGGVDFGKCSAPGTCMLAANTCCGVCGAPTLDDLEPVNEAEFNAYREAICPIPPPCPACPEMLAPNLFAYCDLGQGRCLEADLPTTKFAACSKDADCTLRAGLGCCTCGAPESSWVAVAAAELGALEPMLCKGDQLCADCEPTPPPDLVAACVDGACVVGASGGG